MNYRIIPLALLCIIVFGRVSSADPIYDDNFYRGTSNFNIRQNPDILFDALAKASSNSKVIEFQKSSPFNSGGLNLFYQDNTKGEENIRRWVQSESNVEMDLPSYNIRLFPDGILSLDYSYAEEEGGIQGFAQVRNRIGFFSFYVQTPVNVNYEFSRSNFAVSKNIKWKSFELRPLIGANLIDFKLNGHAPEVNETLEQEVFLPLPYLGFEFKINWLDRFSSTVGMKYTDLEYKNLYAEEMNLSIDTELVLNEYKSVILSYKSYDFEAGRNDILKPLSMISFNKAISIVKKWRF